jgi:small subunit ribosomal protein S16
MAVRIRLRRIGAKKKPFYRVVVADSRSPRDGRFLDTIGWYDPLANPAKFQIDVDKAMRWLSDGALPTDSARSVLSQAGIWQRHTTGATPEASAQTAAEPAPARAAAEPAPAQAAAEPAPTPAEPVTPEAGDEAAEV